jgi:y4mF family transcriptional regulator
VINEGFFRQIVPNGTFYGFFSNSQIESSRKGCFMDKVSDAAGLGALIKKERKSQKLTQEQLSALAGVGARFVRELEHGKKTCHVGLAFDVMRTLGLTLTLKGRGDSQ